MSKIKEHLKFENILLIIFILLVILIIFLGTKVYEKKSQEQEKVYDTIYLLEENVTNSISIDVTHAKEKEYILKVTNYRENIISKTDIDYTIEVENDTLTKIEVIKNEKEKTKALVEKKEKYYLEKNIFPAKKKKTDTYRITIKGTNNTNAEQKINIIIKN